MNHTNRLILVLSLASLCCSILGCSSIRPTDTVKQAIDRGFVPGLSLSNQWTAVEWNFPPNAYLPYSEINSLSLTVPTSSTDKDYYAFYLGKSVTSKKWELFSVQKWEAYRRRWEPVPLKLPEPKPGQ